MGKVSLDYIGVLYHNASPEVAYAAAKAGAFLGDSAAQQVLLEIAQNDHSPFQLNAVKSLRGDASHTASITCWRSCWIRQTRWCGFNRWRILRGASFAISDSVHGGPSIVHHGHRSFQRTVLNYATRVGMPQMSISGDCTKIRTPIILPRWILGSASPAATSGIAH